MEKNSTFNIPSGIVKSKVVVGTNPPKLPNASTPSSKVQTHLFIKGTEPTSTVYYSPKVETKSEEDAKESAEESTEEEIEIPDILEP